MVYAPLAISKRMHYAPLSNIPNDIRERLNDEIITHNLNIFSSFFCENRSSCS